METKGKTIRFYTNHLCPAAHRVHIILTELNIPFEKETVDLNVPRSPEYLRVNPRGLVPALIYNGEILTESAIISQFLVDTYPSHLLPASSDPEGPLTRARIGFFVDTWITKCMETYVKILMAGTKEEQESLVDVLAKAVAKEVEPLLEDAEPFFGGSDKITLAECLVGPFVFRMGLYIAHGLIPESLSKAPQETSPAFHKWSEAVNTNPSILGSTDVETLMAESKVKVAKVKSSA